MVQKYVVHTRLCMPTSMPTSTSIDAVVDVLLCFLSADRQTCCIYVPKLASHSYNFIMCMSCKIFMWEKHGEDELYFNMPSISITGCFFIIYFLFF